MTEFSRENSKPHHVELWKISDIFLDWIFEQLVQLYYRCLLVLAFCKSFLECFLECFLELSQESLT